MPFRYPTKLLFAIEQNMRFPPQYSLGDVTRAFVVSRLFILSLFILGSQFSVFPTPAKEGSIYNPVLQLETGAVLHSLKVLFQAADAGWYLEIAEKGYWPGSSPAAGPMNWAFFPLYPLLVHLAAFVIGSYTIAAVLISHLCFFLALVMLRFYQQDLGDSDEICSRTTWLLAFFPTSYFFSGAFTESAFLLFIVSAFFLIRTRNFVLSGLMMALATATRPTGLIMLPAYAVRLGQEGQLVRLRGLIALFIAPLGAVAYMAYLYKLTGDPFAFSTNQLQWNRGSKSPIELLNEISAHPGRIAIAWDFIWLNLFSLICGLGVSVALLIQRRFSWTLLVALPLLVAASTGNLVSMTRFLLVLFPIFILLGRSLNNPAAERTVFAIFVALLTLLCVLFSQLVTAAMT